MTLQDIIKKIKETRDEELVYRYMSKHMNFVEFIDEYYKTNKALAACVKRALRRAFLLFNSSHVTPGIGRVMKLIHPKPLPHQKDLFKKVINL